MMMTRWSGEMSGWVQWVTFAQRQTEFTGGLGEVKPIRRVTLNHHFSAKPSSSSSTCAGPAFSQSSLFLWWIRWPTDWGILSLETAQWWPDWPVGRVMTHENEDRIAEMAESDCLVVVKLWNYSVPLPLFASLSTSWRESCCRILNLWPFSA